MRIAFTKQIAFAATLAFAVTAPASAQFFIRVDVTSFGPVTCTSTGASASGTGTLAWNVPNTIPNEIGIFSLNGGPTNAAFDTLSPPSDSQTGTLTVSLSLLVATPPPYTLTAEFFPLVNGQAAGQGVRVTTVCPAGGPGTMTFKAIAQTPASIPAVPPEGLALLSALLALAAVVRLRRRRA
jgi:hypothetical protein